MSHWKRFSKYWRFSDKSSIEMFWNFSNFSWIATITSKENCNENLRKSISEIFGKKFMGTHCNALLGSRYEPMILLFFKFFYKIWWNRIILHELWQKLNTTVTVHIKLYTSKVKFAMSQKSVPKILYYFPRKIQSMKIAPQFTEYC